MVIVSRIHSPEPAAASFRLDALREALLARGLVVDVLTTTVPGAGAKGGTTCDRGGRVSRWPALRNKDGYVRGYLPYLSFDVPVALRLLFHRRFDAVVVEPPPTTGLVVRWAAGLRRRPYLYYAADLWSVASLATQAPSLVVSIVVRLERAALRGATRVLTVYPSLASRLEEWVARPCIALVGHGADTDCFRPDGPRAALDTPYVVYAGTASEVHGAGVFVEAMRTVLAHEPTATLVVIGQGEDRPAMEEAARQLPDGAVRFLPRLSPADTATWLRGANAALASVRPGPYGFALATKVFAAAACGVPTVYAGGGEGAALVRDNALGHVVRHDPDEVASAMLGALRAPADTARRERLVSWAREHGSLRAAGDRAAEEVEGVVRGRSRHGS